MFDPNAICPFRHSRMAEFDRLPLEQRRTLWETGGMVLDQQQYEKYIDSGFDPSLSVCRRVQIPKKRGFFGRLRQLVHRVA